MLPPNGVIDIEYPPILNFSEPLNCSNIVGLPEVSCTLDSVSHKITASGWTTYVPSGGSVKFSLANITNPAIAMTGIMLVSTYTDASRQYIIDKGNMTLEPGSSCHSSCMACRLNDARTCEACF